MRDSDPKCKNLPNISKNVSNSPQLNEQAKKPVRRLKRVADLDESEKQKLPHRKL